MLKALKRENVIQSRKLVSQKNLKKLLDGIVRVLSEKFEKGEKLGFQKKKKEKSKKKGRRKKEKRRKVPGEC